MSKITLSNKFVTFDEFQQVPMSFRFMEEGINNFTKTGCSRVVQTIFQNNAIVYCNRILAAISFGRLNLKMDLVYQKNIFTTFERSTDFLANFWMRHDTFPIAYIYEAK